MRPGAQTIALVRRSVTGTDPYGNDTTAEVTETVPGCSVQPVTSSEALGSADRITTRMLLFAPAGVDLAGVDAVDLGAAGRWEVDGDPMPWPDLAGRAHHVEAYLRRVTG